MSDYLLENLNKEQREAVTHQEGPLLIVAGAGTGKTTVITNRIGYLIEQGLAKPDEILALTFTEKAAGEMEERVDKLLPMGYFDLWISTFHGFAERILKEHCLDIGLPGGFKLLNEFEQWALIKKNLDRFELDYYRPLGNPTKFIHALIKHFSRAKDEDISPDEYLEYAEGLKENLDGMLGGGKIRNSKFQIPNPKQIQNPKSKIQKLCINNKSELNEEIAEQEIQRVNEVAGAYHVYQQLLLENGALDFGDLINYCLKLFRERPAILEKYRQQFKYILLDEFQDTNWAQYELVKMLAEPKNNLTVVGDDDQSVYAFRGASMSNILHFKKDYPESREIVLKNNYRSKQNILDLAYKFIQLNNPNRLEYQLNCESGIKDQESGELKQNAKAKLNPDIGHPRSGFKGANALNKKLIAQTAGEGEIGVIQGYDLHDEIDMVLEKIVDLKIKSRLLAVPSAQGDLADENKEEATWNDFAILVRANDSAKDFCNALDKIGLPYIFYSSRGLYAKPEIMDIICYLKLLDNYHESAALFRVLNSPVFNFSQQELVDLNYWAKRKALSLYEVLKNAGSVLNLGAETVKKAEKVLNMIGKHTPIAKNRSASETVLTFLEDSGYLLYLQSQGEQKIKEASGYFNQFLKRIKTFEAASDDKSAKAFLEELNLEIEAGEQGNLAPDVEAGPEAIKIMTVHAAKGLEFKYVFIANLVDKRFPTIERKEQIALPDALVKEILPEGDSHLEEERRLFYVAATRAKDGLYFSWAEDYGGARKKKPSRFLREIGLVNDMENNKEKNSVALSKPQISNFQFPISNQIPNPKFSSPKINNKEEKTEIIIPSYFSYTQLAAFSNCPYQYRFAHILKIPVKGKAVFSFGKTMHATLQKLFLLIGEKQGLGQGNLFGGNKADKTDLTDRTNETNIVSMEEIIKLYEQSWIDDWYENKKQKEEYRKKGKKILEEFYEKHKSDWPKPLLLEKGFNLKISGENESYTVRGVIDRIDDSAGKLKIIDYKTGRPKEKLNFEDKEQLFIYQLALRDLFNKEISSLAFYYLENNSEAEFLGSEDDLAKVKTKILSVIKEIRKGEFPAKPSELCKFCDFKEICEFRKI